DLLVATDGWHVDDEPPLGGPDVLGRVGLAPRGAMTSGERRHAAADGAWRNPRDVTALWPGAGGVDEALFRHTVRGDFWDVLADTGVTLLVTREYEHLLLGLHAGRGAGPGNPRVRGSAPAGVISYLPFPHPS